MPARLPDPTAASTYRLQLRPEFGFDAVAGVAPYLADLGVTHVYLSPILAARPDSTHGYDGVDPTCISDELGGEDAFVAMRSRLTDLGLGVLLDIVPNHLAASDRNPWWRDVLERGRESDYADVFDIDWEASADGELTYRRFFEIDDLVAVRQEDERVFALTHSKIADLVSSGAVNGLRVDHVDGLRDPRRYLERLASLTGVWTVVEKILEGDERLPQEWPVAGTTGYDFMRRAVSVLVDPSGEASLSDTYISLTGDTRAWSDVALCGKYRALDGGLAPDVERVARALGGGDEWRRFVREAAAHLPVYRTYFEPVDDAIARLQQVTGPAMAKGVEDTALYEYARLLALNEVGGDPEAFGLGVDEWHEAMAAAPPGGLLSTATHDHKRGEDVRARLAVLSEVPEWWGRVARTWMAAHSDPDPLTAYFLLQTIVGAWPIEEDRLQTYMEKAVRETGTHTSWADPKPDYERAVRASVRAALADVSAIEAMVEPLIEPGRINGLAQTLLRLTAPGVPDTYQGTELWDHSLVDPDNRRPVDFDRRRRLLAQGDHPKLRVVAAALAVRRQRPDSFAGAYTPLEVHGPDHERVIAFMRGDDVATVVPRFGTRGRPDAKVELPPGPWQNVFPEDFPVALFVR